jgi:hypothetical protein
MTFSAFFTLRIEATSMFGQPLSKRCDFHQCSPQKDCAIAGENYSSQN